MKDLMERLRVWARDYSALDLRALALLRMSLATLILVDLVTRAGHLVEHYGDYGVFPRSVWELWLPNGYWSLHLLFGSPYWSLALMLAAALGALFLLVGFHTRLTTIFLWLLTVSLTHANPLILQGGDGLLRIILFIAIFLPLGARFSLDAVRHPSRTRSVANLWTFAYLIQIGLIYFFAAMHKSGAAWQEGTAVYYALSVNGFDAMRTALGDVLYRYPDVMRFCTYAVHTLQWAAVPLLFSPIATRMTRTAGMALLALMHIAFASTMHLGMFSWIAVTALMPLMSPGFIDLVMRYLTRYGFGNLTLYYDGDCGFCRLSSHLIRILLLLPQTTVAPAQQHPAYYAQMQERHSWVITDSDNAVFFSYQAFVRLVRASPLFFIFTPLLTLPPCVSIGERVYHTIATHRPYLSFPATGTRREYSVRTTLILKSLLAAAAVLYIATAILGNLADTHRIHSVQKAYAAIKKPIVILGLSQHWSMFAPNPAVASGWIIAIGRYADNTELSLLPEPHTLSYEREEDPSHGLAYFDARQRKYAFNLAVSGIATPYARSFGQYLCMRESKNTTYRGELREVELVFMRRFSFPEAHGVHTPILLLRYSCPR